MEKKMIKARQLPNKYIYPIFLLATLIFLMLGNWGTALIFGGIGLAFDPFDQSIPFSKRPIWQRTVLLIHLLLVLSILVWLLIR